MSTRLPSAYEGAPNDQSFEVLPAGTYTADITNFAQKSTRAGDGSYAEIELTLKGANVDGRKIWARHTITNRNDKAVAIGTRQLKDLANAALGTNQQLSDLAQLAAKSVKVELTVREGQNGYGPSNDVKRYYPANAPAPTDGSAALPATGQSNDAPW